MTTDTLARRSYALTLSVILLTLAASATARARRDVGSSVAGERSPCATRRLRLRGPSGRQRLLALRPPVAGTMKSERGTMNWKPIVFSSSFRVPTSSF